jgi:hypothetical protein
MRMASDPPNRLTDADLWLRDLERAQSALEISGETSDGHRGTRYLRARSERAAVRLTYCAWAALGKLRDIEAYRQDPPDLVGILAGAVEDLYTVASALPAVRAQVSALAIGRDTRLEVLNWVSLQTAANQECARLIGEMLLTVQGGADFHIFPGKRHPVVGGGGVSALRRASTDSTARLDIERQIAELPFADNLLSLDRLMLQTIKQRWCRSVEPPTPTEIL